MTKTLKDKISDKLVNAFINNKIISPIPIKFTKKLTEADKFRKLCESKIKDPIIGFKAGGTGIPLMKKLKEKEPFIASVFKKNLIKSGKKVKINKSTLGISFKFKAGSTYLFGPNINGPAFLEKTGSVIIVVFPSFIKKVACPIQPI